MNDITIQSRTDYLTGASTAQGRKSNGNFRELLDAIGQSESETGESSRSRRHSSVQTESMVETQSTQSSETTGASSKRRGWDYSDVENTDPEPAAQSSGTTSETETETENDSDTETDYRFRPQFFETIIGMVNKEIQQGRDPNVSLDGTWRYYDSCGTPLPEPIPLDIEGGFVYNTETKEWNWTGGENPYDLYWLDDSDSATQTTAQNSSDSSQTTSRREAPGAEQTGAASTTAEEDDSTEETDYRFRPQFFETIIGMVNKEIQQGRDPNVSLDGTWRYYDSCGTPLPEPIPLDIKGGFVYNTQTQEWNWSGGENPYDLYWMKDEASATA